MFASEHLLGKPISIQITGLYNCEEQMDIFSGHIIIWVGLINGNFERLNLPSLWISIMDLLLLVNASDILCLMYYELFIYTELKLTTLILLTTWHSGYQDYSQFTNFHGICYLYWSTLEFTQLQ